MILIDGRDCKFAKKIVDSECPLIWCNFADMICRYPDCCHYEVTKS